MMIIPVDLHTDVHHTKELTDMRKSNNGIQSDDGSTEYTVSQLIIVRRVCIAGILFLIILMFLIAFHSCVERNELVEHLPYTSMTDEKDEDNEARVTCGKSEMWLNIQPIPCEKKSDSGIAMPAEIK